MALDFDEQFRLISGYHRAVSDNDHEAAARWADEVATWWRYAQAKHFDYSRALMQTRKWKSIAAGHRAEKNRNQGALFD